MKRPTRRDLLGLALVSIGTGLAGCLGGDDDGAGDAVLDPPTRGDDDAPVTVTVFEDFSCPHCRSFEEDVYPDIVEAYVEPGDVRYRRRDFPFIDVWSWRVGSAARAVQVEVDDAACFDFVEAIYPHQGSYSYDTIAAVAADVADVGEAAREAAEAETYRATLEADRSHGEELGVGGTPAVVVDDELLESTAYDAIAAAVDDRL